LSLSLISSISTPSEESELFAGYDKGELLQIDINGKTLYKSNTHTAGVSHIVRGMRAIYTIDENGGIRIWLPDELGRYL
jgi:hypothetical protein